MSKNSAGARPPGLRALTPYAALIGAIASLCVGTSFAKQLFPLVGAQGATAYRVGFSALLLCLIWRPWRQPLTRDDLAILREKRADVTIKNLRDTHHRLARLVAVGGSVNQGL